MAIEWIKLPADVHRTEQTAEFSRRLKLDSINEAVGLLARFWSYAAIEADAAGRMAGATRANLDHVLDHPGLADALVAVGWLRVDGDDLVIINCAAIVPTLPPGQSHGPSSCRGGRS